MYVELIGNALGRHFLGNRGEWQHTVVYGHGRRTELIWPGTDKWAAGELPWRGGDVERAWGAMAGDPRSVHSGPKVALLTDFSDAGRPTSL